MSTPPKTSDRLKAYRKAAKISQEELAVRLDFTRSYISQIEAGVKEPGPRFLRDLAHLESVLEKGDAHRVSVDAPGGARSLLKALREKKGLSVADLAKKVGREIGVIQALEDTGARISETTAEKLAAVLGCEKEDLLAGSDHSDMTFSGSPMIGAVGQKPNIELPEGYFAKYVPLISWAQAGTMKSFSDGAYRYEGYLTLNVTDRNAIAIKIRGDSMLPKFEEGDVVILSPSREARNGELVIALLNDDAGGDVMFKIFHAKDSGEKIVLTSYNPAFPPLEYQRENFQWIYPAATVMKTLNQ